MWECLAMQGHDLCTSKGRHTCSGTAGLWTHSSRDAMRGRWQAITNRVQCTAEEQKYFASEARCCLCVIDGHCNGCAYPDAICIKVWAGVDMTILADTILGVLLDGSAASRQVRLHRHTNI